MAMNMSKRRAQNVVDYLVDTFGIDRSRLSVEGFGQGRRFAYNTSAEGQQENRRVNIIINYPN
jgi:OOP family OmpA-OmpF porin